jgi:N-acetylglucosaminyldiphosphoundecaprenol N-acetyl-beta-D-mannosaminyltransferase
MKDVIGKVGEWVRSGSKDRYIVVVNVAKLVLAHEDPHLRRIIDTADLVGVDGMPLVWYSRLSAESLPEKVSGIDIMMAMFETADIEGWSFYFLGTTSAIMNATVEKFREEYPNARLCGFHNGYFSLEEETQIVSDIGKSGANILLIGFGSPRKELFIERWKGRFGVNVIHGVGGSFDVYAGATRRAPRWMQRAGLEWFYRLSQEPRRLFVRYAVTNVKFFLLICGDLSRSVTRSVKSARIQ